MKRERLCYDLSMSFSRAFLGIFLSSLIAMPLFAEAPDPLTKHDKAQVKPSKAKKRGGPEKNSSAKKGRSEKITKPDPKLKEVEPKKAKAFGGNTRSVEVADFADGRFYRFKVYSIVGMNILSGSAFVTGLQMGYAPWKTTPFYVGPDFTFSLFSPGSLFATLAGGWYDFRVKGAPRLTLSLGAFAGPGFPSLMPQYPKTAFVAMGFLAVSQEIDDLVSFRGEFRPGAFGSQFSFMMNLSLSFRFT